MSSKDPTIGALSGFVIGVLIFFSGFRKWSKIRTIASIPTSKVRSVALGLSEFFGKAKLVNEPILSPISQTPCTFYKYEIEEYRKSGKSSKWVTVQSAESYEPFYLEDETGKILVFPSGCTLVAHADQHFKTNLIFSGDENFRAALFRLGVPMSGNRMRANESYIQEGDSVYVLGEVKSIRDDSEVNQERLIVSKPKSGYFIISDRSERELLSHLSWHTLLKIVGGAILSIICLLILLIHFNLIKT